MKKLLLSLAIICVGLQAQSDEDIFTTDISSGKIADEAFPSSYTIISSTSGSIIFRPSFTKATTQELQNRFRAINRKQKLTPILKQERFEIAKELKRRKHSHLYEK